MNHTIPLFAALLILISACSESEKRSEDKTVESSTSLVVLPSSETGVTFRNTVNENVNFHYFLYMYLYHGGGVAVGDVNNDGLPDLYFTANELSNRLYLNKGNFQFEDITEGAGVACAEGWKTGVTMVDINADGFLDIYVCRSGMIEDPIQRENKLYVNNGDLTFTERASEYGLAANGHSSMAYFGDLDNDSDLDMYLLSHRVDWHMNTKVIVSPDFLPNEYETDRIFINNGDGKFVDRTEFAGVKNKAWGLGSAIGDFNNDGFNDIYVANDFLEPDFLYINDQNGRFVESNTQYTRHISFNGMGVDWADFNNDAHPDLCVLDMTPPDHKRSKENMASMRPDQFFQMVEVGWHHQYMINTLQLNNGNGAFSEIAHMAGIDRTEWSWAPLFTDLDNDGLKDLLITNGIKRDVGNNDFKVKIRERIAREGQNLDFDQVMAMIPQTISANLVYRNTGDVGFEKANGLWNYNHMINSSGAAYADLDNDGDIDLITCNIDNQASIIKNTTNDEGNTRFVQFALKGSEVNPFAIGSKLTLYTSEGLQYSELMLARGFQSSVEPEIHFGLGDATIDSLKIKWPDGSESIHHQIQENSLNTLTKGDGKSATPSVNPKGLIFKDITRNSGLRHVHQESVFNDFATEILLPHRQSQHGPGLSVGDVNADGLDDIFIGASTGRSPTLFIQASNNRFAKARKQPWKDYKKSEEIGSHFFDADGDGDLDLYVASGSTEFPLGDKAYKDRLYLNDGTGSFSEAKSTLPPGLASTQIIASADIDADGDLDLFVGGRNVPGAYPKSPNSSILLNENGKFSDATKNWNSDLQFAGMVTDAVFADITEDNLPDLIICGEWSAIRFFENTGDSFKEITENVSNTESIGWWYSLSVNDLDNDGDLDIIAGNLGLNNKFHPKKEKPLHIYMNDFDQNGTNDIVLAKYSKDECVPVRGRECSSDQMPFIKDKFPTFSQFADADITTIYGKDQLDAATHLTATEFASMLLINEGGRFEYKQLPRMAQLSPINGSLITDVNNDGHKDIVAVGNMFGAEVETTRYDASIGSILIGDGKMNFKSIPTTESGFFAPYNAKKLASIQLTGTKGYVVANNMGPLQVIIPNK